MQIERPRIAFEGVSHRQVDVGELKLHVVEAGAAPFGQRKRPLVVLLHGFPEFWWTWHRQIRALADAGFHVAAPDMRGYNLSDKPPSVGDYAMPHLTADVRGLIRALGHERAVVVGHDWGAAVAWEFAAAYPEALERLCILSSPYPTVLLRELRKPAQIKRSWYMFFFQLPVLPERVLARDDFALLRRIYARDGLPKDEVDRYVEALSREGALSSAINYYRARMRGLLARRLEKRRRIDAPVLVLWGERDTYLPSTLAAPPPDLVPNARVERIPDATHWVQRDAPERVNELILEFILDLRVGGKPS